MSTNTQKETNDTTYTLQLLGTLKTKSAVIRYLSAEGWKRGRIANSFEPPIRYQHVRNVLTKGLKKVEVREMMEGDL